MLLSWCFGWLLCLCGTSKLGFAAEVANSKVALDFSTSKVRLVASKTRSNLSPQAMQLLTDGDVSTCITATPKDSKKSAVTMKVTFTKECLSNVSVQIVMANSSPHHPKVYLRKPCAGKHQWKSCEEADDKPLKSHSYDCPKDQVRIVAVIVPADHSICEITIYYTQLKDFPTFLPLPSKSRVDLTKSIQNYQIGQTARAVIGQTLHLHCNASAQPHPTYKWQILREDSNVGTTDSVVVKGNTLTITKVQRKHEGVYQCTVSNKVGSIVASSHVKVYGFVGQSCEVPFVLNKTERSIFLSLSCLAGDTADPYDCRITRYSVFHRVANDDSNFAMSISQSPSLTLTNLIPYTAYEIKAQAHYSHPYCNNVTPSRSLISRLDPEAPTAPTGIRVTSRTATSARVEWNPIVYRHRSVIAYRIYYTATHVESSRSTNATSIWLHELKPYTKYTFVLLAVVRLQNVRNSSEDLKSKRTAEHSFVTLQSLPSRPFRVRVTNRTATSAKVVWQKPVRPHGQIAYYIVTYEMGNNSHETRVSDNVTNWIYRRTETVLRDLTPFTVYSVWIKAVNIEKRRQLVSNASNAKLFATLKAAPSPPQRVKVSNIQTNSVEITWQAPVHPNGPIARYEIRIAQGNITNDVNENSRLLELNEIVDGRMTTYTVNGLAQLSKYSVWIIAVNIENSQLLRSDPSLINVFETTGGNLSVPHSLHSSVTNNSVTITWDRPRDPSIAVTSYTVKLFSQNVTQKMLLSMIVENTTTTITKLSPFTNYRVLIAALVRDVSTRSVALDIKTRKNTPGPLINVKFENITSRYATVSWSLPTLTESYDIAVWYRVFAPSRSGVIVWDRSKRETVLPSTTRLLLRRLTPYTTYHAWVAVIVDDGAVPELRSPKVGPIRFTTLAEASSPPRNVTYSDVTPRSVFVTWSKPKRAFSRIAKYKVSLHPSDGSPISRIISTEADSLNLSTIITGLEPYTKYVIDIRAGTVDVTSNVTRILWSDRNADDREVTFITDQTAPSSPGKPETNNVLSRSAFVHWEPPHKTNGDTQFYILTLFQRKDFHVATVVDEERWAIVHTSRTNYSTNHTKLTHLSPYTWYKVAVSAVNIFEDTKLEGNQTSTIFRSADEVPTAPSNCSVDKRNVTSIRMSWHPPFPFDYKIVFYQVTVNSMIEGETTAHVLRVYDRDIEVTGLHPYTIYNITIAAVTNNTKILEGPPCYLNTRTKVGMPPAPRKPSLYLNVTKKEHSLVVDIPLPNNTNGPIKSVEVVIAELEPGVSSMRIMAFPGTKDDRFDQVYLLKANTSYAFYVRWIAKEEDSEEDLISVSEAAMYSTDPHSERSVLLPLLSAPSLFRPFPIKPLPTPRTDSLLFKPSTPSSPSSSSTRSWRSTLSPSFTPRLPHSSGDQRYRHHHHYHHYCSHGHHHHNEQYRYHQAVHHYTNFHHFHDHHFHHYLKHSTTDSRHRDNYHHSGHQQIHHYHHHHHHHNDRYHYIHDSSHHGSEKQTSED